MAQVILCPGCKRTLAIQEVGIIISRHHGRMWIGNPVCISCEQCGAVWVPVKQGGAESSGEQVAGGTVGQP